MLLRTGLGTRTTSLNTPTFTNRSCVIGDKLVVFVICCLTHAVFAEWYPSRECCRQRRVQQRRQGHRVRLVVRQAQYARCRRVSDFTDARAASVPSTTPSVSLEDAIAKAETTFNGNYNEWPATLEFVAKEDGSLALAHVMQIENEETGAWFEAFVDAHSGEIVQLTDFVSKATVSASSVADNAGGRR